MTNVQAEATLRMILARLSWPLRMVRWNAAREYGALLGSSKYGALALRLYFEWLSTRRFESEVTSGLAVLQCTHGRDIPDFLDLVRSIKKPSLLADVMLQFIYGVGWCKGGWQDAHFGLAPGDFTARKYFEEYRRAHVAPVLSTNLEDLQRRTGFPFMRQWSYEWQRLTKEMDAPHSGYPHYFIGPTLSRSGVMGQFSQAQCDVLRSAYLRTLALAVTLGVLPVRDSGYYATDCLPLNGDLVTVKPQHRPTWLADLPEQACDAGASLEAIARRLTAPRGKVRAVSLHVPIDAKRFEFGELFISSVLATPNFEPDPSDTYYFQKQTLWILDDRHSYSGSLNDEDLQRLEISGAKGKALPLCLGLMPMPYGFWHGEYMHQGIALPASFNLPADVRVSCSETGIKVEHGEEVLSTLQIWHDQWTPLYPRDGNTRCGMVTDFAIDDIKRAEARHGMKLAWVAQLRLWEREKDYDEFKLKERREFYFD